ncbi:hypothetical protein L484_012796 [Morus notabilis]|uniref:Uncharacterized protein n=1 Tax=Morus notabilis TaxID=981085 RepID=W9SAZ7_9ROSA|nr:hypothetical protein L484_012796 [Morus notabilis]
MVSILNPEKNFRGEFVRAGEEADTEIPEIFGPIWRGNAMENAMEIVPPSSEHLDLDTIRSRAKELEEMLSSLEGNDSALFHSDLEKLVKHRALKFQSRMEEIGSEGSDVSFLEDKDFDTCLEHLGEELNLGEAKNSRMSEEIEVLTRTYAEGKVLKSARGAGAPRGEVLEKRLNSYAL